MTLNELHNRLIEAYSPDNLNRIALTLISFYKNQQFSILKKIANHISDSISIDIDDNGKGFSKFMMLYHPDRANFHIKVINQLLADNNYDGLLEYSHILLLTHIEEVAASLEDYEEIDYSPVYEWDFNTEGFTIIHDNDSKKSSSEHSAKENKSTRFYNFYDAVKVRMFDSTDKEYPSYYLEDIDEFELASSDINDLEGVEFCKQAKNLDLSDNHICDITPLFGLSLLEELNLSDNDIRDIDVLSNLENLKEINLANNSIDDISPIMNLPWLEYVDLRGTKVSEKQIEELKQLGVIVDI
jgi:Leucine-rich repeat (LRR) protein